jgi:hypothetical protein
MVGFTILYLICWWLLARLATPGRRALWLLLLSAFCVPAAFGREGSAILVPPADVVADVGSDRLWSVTLGPGQGLARLQPVETGRGELQVRVRLAEVYEGPARLLAAVNGVHLGELKIPQREDKGQAEASVAVPAGVLACGVRAATEPACAAAGTSQSLPLPPPPIPGGPRTALVVIWQDRPDPRLRFVVQRAAGGATLGADNSWFFDGEGWRRGVVHAASGRIAPGLWHVFLAPGHVGR